MSNPLPNKTLLPVISFDFLFDTDFGLIKYIQDNYRDEEAFNLGILNKSDREILSLLYTRTDPNPLSIISTGKVDIDALYESFMTYCKKKICKQSIIEKANYRFMKSLVDKTFGIMPSIICRDNIEESMMKKYFGKASIISTTDSNSIAAKDPFYIKDYKILLESKVDGKLRGKTIYTTGRKYNIEYFKGDGFYILNGNDPIVIGADYSIKESSNNGRT